MLQLAGLAPFRSTQIVGGTVTGGAAGPYTTDFTLTTSLIDYNKAMVIPLFSPGYFLGATASGDYFKWSLTSNGNLRITTLQTGWTSAPNLYWLVLEFYTCKGKVTAATNITGTAAGNFDVTIAPPDGASTAKALAVLTCQPQNYAGHVLLVSLAMPSLTTVRFIFPGTDYNTSKPVQAEVMFF